MFSLVHGRGRYYAYSERVLHLWIKTEAKQKQLIELEALLITRSSTLNSI